MLLLGQRSDTLNAKSGWNSEKMEDIRTGVNSFITRCPDEWEMWKNVLIQIPKNYMAKFTIPENMVGAAYTKDIWDIPELKIVQMASRNGNV